MARDSLTGSRIRERRVIAGLRQAELARRAGISASYLNLIEHNRRRIGGKLLVDIAAVLGVEPSVLSEGAEATLIAALREAAVEISGVQAEIDRLDEFAGRFPGWAGLLAHLHGRIGVLERTVETLSDRLTHDPHLAASLHEVLSTATAIRSTASILAEPGEIEPQWRDRFHRNLNQDAERLADSSKALMTYLDESGNAQDRQALPLEEVETFFAAQGHHIAALETGGDVAELSLDPLQSPAARRIARDMLALYAADARSMPLDDLETVLVGGAPDPLQLAERFGVDFATVLRRLAALPERLLSPGAGLAVCDASGTILFRKTVSGFTLPMHGEACPLWPLFTAFNRPLVPLRRRVVQQGRTEAAFDCFAIAWPQTVPDFDSDPVYHSVMLVLPVERTGPGSADAQSVGSSCRVCPCTDCKARREPSVLSEGF